MSALKNIQISIPNPCTRNWDDMSPVSGGRFCSHCQTPVVDFSTWTDAELFQFFSKKNSRLCGRFVDTQLNRPITLPYQPHSRLYRIAVAMGLTLICAQTPQLYAQIRPPRMEQNSFFSSGDMAKISSGTIKGRVLDEKKEPMISAVIHVFRDNKLVGGTITDFDGNYSVGPFEPGEYDLMSTSVGYDSVIVSKIKVIAINTIINIDQGKYRLKNMTLSVGMINYKVPLTTRNGQSNRTFTKTEIDRMPH